MRFLRQIRVERWRLPQTLPLPVGDTQTLQISRDVRHNQMLAPLQHAAGCHPRGLFHSWATTACFRPPRGSVPSRSIKQLGAIQLLQDTLTGWSADASPANCVDRLAQAQHEWDDRLLRQPAPRVPGPPAPAPRAATHQCPRATTQHPVPSEKAQPVAHRTRSAQTRAIPSDLAADLPPPAAAEQPVSQQTCSRYALAASLLTALPVLDLEYGKLLEHKQLRRHPRLKKTWDTSYANELGRLCQGVGEGTAGPDK